MNVLGVHTVQMAGISITTAKTLVELAPATNRPIVILRAWIEADDSEASQALAAGIHFYTATGTGTAETSRAHSGVAAAGTTTSKTNMTAEGAGKTIIVRRAFNILNGLEMVFTPEEYIRGNAGRLLGLATLTTATAIVLSAGITYAEI